MKTACHVGIVLLVGFGAACGGSVRAARLARVDVVLQWNEQVMAVGGPQVQRTLAMVHLAMFDAINAVEPRFHAYLALPAPAANLSKAVAAAAAAHGVLVRLFPDQRHTLDAALARTLFELADSSRPTDAIAFGDLVASEIYSARLSDNILAAGPPLRLDSAPGDYVLTDPAPAEPMNTSAARWRPFAIESTSRFRPDAPRALASTRYARDFQEVRRLGGAAGRRSSEQDLVARWFTESPLSQLNRIARTEAALDGGDLLDHARLFALLNVSLADSFTSAFDAAYTYRTWRPITAIRHADKDGNVQTEPDFVWSPFVPAPLSPEFPSVDAALHAAGAVVLSAHFGRPHAFVATSSAVPETTRSYRSFEAFAEEAGMAGIYGGRQFRAAVEAGAAQGSAIGRWVIQQCFTAANHGSAAAIACRSR